MVSSADGGVGAGSLLANSQCTRPGLTSSQKHASPFVNLRARRTCTAKSLYSPSIYDDDDSGGGNLAVQSVQPSAGSGERESKSNKIVIVLLNEVRSSHYCGDRDAARSHFMAPLERESPLRVLLLVGIDVFLVKRDRRQKG